MYEMRDGSTVDDARLGLLAQDDPRNRDYLAEGSSKRPNYWALEPNQIMDQGADGACVGYALTHTLRAQGWDHPRIDETFAWSVYTSAQRIDPWPGGEYAGAYPTMSGTSLLAGIKVLHRAGYVPGYRWAYNVTQLKAGLAKGPGVLGLHWRESMNEPDSDGVVEVKGRRAGGHAVAVIGFHDGLFTIANSWGTGYGVDGLARISSADMKKLLRDPVASAVFPRRHSHVTG